MFGHPDVAGCGLAVSLGRNVEGVPIDDRGADMKPKDGPAVVSTFRECAASHPAVSTQPVPQRCLRCRGQRVGADPHETWTGSGRGPLLARLEEEVDPARWPTRSAGTVRQSPSSAKLRDELIEESVELNDVIDARHVTDFVGVGSVAALVDRRRDQDCLLDIAPDTQRGGDQSQQPEDQPDCPVLCGTAATGDRSRPRPRAPSTNWRECDQARHRAIPGKRASFR